MAHNPKTPIILSMNEKPDGPANKTPAATANTRAPARRAPSLTGGLALIVSLIALVASAYLWYMLGEKQGLMGSNVVSEVSSLAAQVEALQAKSAASAQDLATVKETQEVIKAGMEKMTADFASNRNEWLLSEAEQLMLIANNRLQLAQDVPLALAALRGADRLLKQLSNPNLLPVRKELAREISQLESLNNIDFDGIALRLGNIAGRIDDLPLAVQTTFKETEAGVGTAVPAGNAWSRFWRELWHDLGNMIRIRHDADKRRPLLPAEQQYFLRENLRLMLYGGQLALLRRDEATYQQNLKSARAWLEDYYDMGAPPVQRTSEELDRLARAAVTFAAPDISGALRTLQRITGRHDGK